MGHITLTNGNWVIHAEYSCFLHPPFLAKIGYIPEFKASNARVLDEISSGLARMIWRSDIYLNYGDRVGAYDDQERYKAVNTQ